MGIRRGQAGFQRQQETAHLAAGGHLSQGGQGLAGVGGEQELHRIGPLLAGGCGLQGHGKAHIGQTHGPQGLHQLLLQGRRGLLAGPAEGAIGAVAALAGGCLSGLQGLQAGLGPSGGQLQPQLIPQLDQRGEVAAMAALQRLELGDALLQGPQALGITLEAGAIALEITGQILQSRQAITAAAAQGRNAGIKGLHLAQFLLAGRQVIQG